MSVTIKNEQYNNVASFWTVKNMLPAKSEKMVVGKQIKKSKAKIVNLVKEGDIVQFVSFDAFVDYNHYSPSWAMVVNGKVVSRMYGYEIFRFFEIFDVNYLAEDRELLNILEQYKNLGAS